jgi:hypothetical protein
MARYQTIDTSPRFPAVDLQRQLVAGTFERTIDWLVASKLEKQVHRLLNISANMMPMLGR